MHRSLQTPRRHQKGCISNACATVCVRDTSLHTRTVLSSMAPTFHDVELAWAAGAAATQSCARGSPGTSPAACAARASCACRGQVVSSTSSHQLFSITARAQGPWKLRFAQSPCGLRKRRHTKDLGSAGCAGRERTEGCGVTEKRPCCSNLLQFDNVMYSVQRTSVKRRSAEQRNLNSLLALGVPNVQGVSPLLVNEHRYPGQNTRNSPLVLGVLV